MDNEEEYEGLDEDDDEEISELMADYELDDEEAIEVRSLMEEEGLDPEEAVDLRNFDSEVSSGGWGSFILIALIAWGIYSFVHDDEDKNLILQQSQNYPVYENSGDCSDLYPENPYNVGSGHYAGFEWAERNGVAECGGNSSSFIEGCEDYLTQEEAYEVCVE